MVGELCVNSGFEKIFVVLISICGIMMRYQGFGMFIGVSFLFMFLVKVVCLWVKIGMLVFRCRFRVVMWFLFQLSCQRWFKVRSVVVVLELLLLMLFFMGKCLFSQMLMFCGLLEVFCSLCVVCMIRLLLCGILVIFVCRCIWLFWWVLKCSLLLWLRNWNRVCNL